MRRGALTAPPARRPGDAKGRTGRPAGTKREVSTGAGEAEARAPERQAETELLRLRQQRLLELLGGDDCFGPCSTGKP